jgi:hypothetical protein
VGSQSVAGVPHGKGPPVGFALRARTDGSSLDRGAPSRLIQRRPQRHNQPNSEANQMNEQLTIKTIEANNGRIEYVLIDTVTGEQLLRGSWRSVKDMQRKLNQETTTHG